MAPTLDTYQPVPGMVERARRVTHLTDPRAVARGTLREGA